MMKNNKLILMGSICIIFLFSIISLASAALPISACGQDINASGSYLLTQSITSTATCLIANSSNTEIDCAGYTITYGTAGGNSVFGIEASHSTTSQVNLTIKNCIITKSSAAGSSGRGISMTRFSNSTITNNTIRTNGTTSGIGIYILTGSNGNNVSGNNIITRGSGATNYGIYFNAGSSDSIAEYNNITTGTGTATTDNYGITITDPRAIIRHNWISTSGSGDSNFGVFSSGASSSRIVNNTIYTSGTTGNNRGLYLSASDLSIIANNTINTTGQASPGIYISSSNSMNVLNNKINSTADAIYIISSVLTDFTSLNISRDNTRFGRNITVYGGGALNLPCPNNAIIDNPADGALKFIGCNNITVQNWYRPKRDTDGLLFVNSDSNKIINNTINGGLEALDMVNGAGTCDNNIIANNTFSSFGYLNDYAIHIYGNYNAISGNSLSTSGVTSGNNAINIQSDFNNITNNEITTGGTSGNVGINLEANVDNNLIENNRINTSGTSSGNTGIYFVDTCLRNIVRNNTITTAGTSGNLGMRLVSVSNNNLIEYNTFYAKGSTSGNNGLELYSSSNNTFRFNNVYAGYGAGTTDNDAISLVSSKNNTFTNNVLFANGTSTSITSSAIFLQSASQNNTFADNIIIKSVGNALELDFSTTYPYGNTFQNNSLNNVSGSDLFFLDAGINGTSLINQPIGKYNFTGVGGIITVKNTQFGEIAFTSPVNGSNGNLSNDIQIRANFAQVDSSKKELNSSANISFYNLATNFYNPLISADGIYECNSTTVPACINFTSLNAGNVSFSVSAWSNYSIANSTNIIIPNIAITYPQNTSYNINISQLNYTVSDISLRACWYSLDNGATNITITCGNNVSSLTSSEGSNSWTIWANNSQGNLNYSQVIFYKDTIAPYAAIVSPQNITYNNATILVNITNNSDAVNLWWYNGTANLTYSQPITYTFSQGSNTLIAYANDSAGNLNFTSITFFVDSIAPTINIALPEVKTYSYNSSLPLNFSVSDSGVGIGDCWYNLNNGENTTLANCQNITFNAAGDGNYVLNLYANDTFGNLANVLRSFSVNTQLAISLSAPTNNFWLNLQQVQFNYTVSTFGQVNNCSLWINSNGWHQNQTNSSAINTTGGVNQFLLNLSDGSYLWNVYCDDTYNGFAPNNYTINIDSTLPIINLNSPLNNTISAQNVSIALNFIVSEINLQACKYSLNNGQNNRTISCINGNNNLTFGYLNGTYNLTLWANDSAGNLASSMIYNIIINYDIIAPSLSLSQPTGTKSSGTGIPLQFSLSDNADAVSEMSCWFNVTYTSTGGYVSGLESVAVVNCLNTTFNVPSDSDYSLKLSARDRTGNLNFTSLNFTVSTSSTPPSGGNNGGGGGGGGGSIISNKTKKQETAQAEKAGIEMSGLSDLIVKAGELKTMGVEVKNIGEGFLNNCKLEGSEWISGKGSRGISPGEIAEFILTISVPNEANEDKTLTVSIVCDEARASRDFKASFEKQTLEIRIKTIEQNGDELEVVYTAKSLLNEKQNVNVEYRINDKEGDEIASGQDSFSLEAAQELERTAVINLQEDAIGEHILKITSNSASIEETIILGNQGSLMGRAIMLPGGGMISIIVMVIFALAFAIIIIKRMFRKKIVNEHFGYEKVEVKKHK